MSLLGMDALKAEIARIRDEMERTWFSFGEGGLRAVMERFFKDTNATSPARPNKWPKSRP